MDEMMKVTETEIQARERTVAMTTPASTKPNKELPTAAAPLTGGSSGPSCSYCQQAHSSNSCRVVTHPHARKQRRQDTVLCVCVEVISAESATDRQVPQVRW